MNEYKYLDISVLKGQRIVKITKGNNLIRFDTDQHSYIMQHNQDCCESVSINKIVGDLQSLVGKKIISASDIVGTEKPAECETPEYHDESFTWSTFILKAKGIEVKIVWYGTSNGYYSETVNIDQV